LPVPTRRLLRRQSWALDNSGRMRMKVRRNPLCEESQQVEPAAQQGCTISIPGGFQALSSLA